MDEGASVGMLAKEDDAIPQWSVCRNKEVAKRPSQHLNGGAARLRVSPSRDERERLVSVGHGGAGLLDIHRLCGMPSLSRR